MNYKAFLTVLTVLTIIATLCICIMQPKMHKSLLVYSSEFQIVPQTEVQVEVQNIPTVAQNESTTPQAVKVIHFEDYKNDVQTDYQTVTTPTSTVSTQQTYYPQQTTTNKVNYTTTQTTPNQYKNTVQVTPVQTQTYTTKQPTTTTKVVNTPTTTTTKVNSPTYVNNNPQIDLQKIVENNKKYQNTTPVTTQTTAPRPVTTTTTQTPVKVASAPVGVKTTTPVTTQQQVQPQKPVQQAVVPKVLTPQEEEIAWQIWRSNLQNKIMQDAKLPNVPQGTIFKFTFDVDKYGKVSNIHTSCTNNPQYTPYAIQYIAPVIRAYQGRSILNFPQGSQRVTTSFVGSFKVSNSSKYSTAGDYNDTERISR